MSLFAFENIPERRKRILQQYSGEIERIGKANPFQREISFGEYETSRGTPQQYRIENPFYQSPESIRESATRAVAERARAFEASQTKLYEKQTADIAKQLQILQESKSAYEQMQKDYRRMMRKDTKAKEKAIEKRREALQISRANAARATAGAGLQIQYGGGVTPSGGGFMPRMGGTSQFKTRQSNMVNI